MTDRNEDDGGELLFSAVLQPYRSLSPRGFAWLLMLVAATCFASGLLFWSRGAWPIAIFFCIDIVAVQFAFRLNYRAARAREIVEMTRERLCVTKVTPAGRSSGFEFNPYWARFDVQRVPDWGIVAMVLSSHGRTIRIGDFLNPDDRESFADAFAAALASARRS